jgi:proteasome lid subunit RPN8/RPN11
LHRAVSRVRISTAPRSRPRGPTIRVARSPTFVEPTKRDDDFARSVHPRARARHGARSGWTRRRDPVSGQRCRRHVTKAMRLSPRDLSAIRGQASNGYPEEICGLLLGREAEERGGRTVTRVVPIENARTDERNRRYIIPAAAVRDAGRSGAVDGLEVLGFYHSHPDHPAEPSTCDLEHAWPWYTYVIVPVATARAGDPRAWRLKDDRTGFEEVRIECTEPESTSIARTTTPTGRP